MSHWLNRWLVVLVENYLFVQWLRRRAFGKPVWRQSFYTILLGDTSGTEVTYFSFKVCFVNEKQNHKPWLCCDNGIMKSDMKWISWIWGFTVGVIRLWWQKDYASHAGKKRCYCVMAMAAPHRNMNRDMSLLL